MRVLLSVLAAPRRRRTAAPTGQSPRRAPPRCCCEPLRATTCHYHLRQVALARWLRVHVNPQHDVTATLGPLGPLGFGGAGWGVGVAGVGGGSRPGPSVAPPRPAQPTGSRSSR